MEWGPMSSRQSLATRDPIRAQNFEPLRRIIASTLQISTYKQPGWHFSTGVEMTMGGGLSWWLIPDIAIGANAHNMMQDLEC